MMCVAMATAALCQCSNSSNPVLMTIQNPAVQAKVLGNAEKDLLAGGGALLLSGGNSGAAVAAMTAQEVENIKGLQEVLAKATPATVTTAPAVSATVETAPAAPSVVATAVASPVKNPVPVAP